MNFSPNNEQGILSLVSALKAGMDPSAAYSVLGNIEQQQAQQVANRQERLGGLAQLLMGAAQGGMPYGGASALADAAPGPMGPAVEQMLSALYPSGDQVAPAPPMSAAGEPIAPPPGYYDQAGGENPMMPGTPNAGPQAMSPAFQPPQPSPTEMISMQSMEQEQAINQALTQFAAEAAQAKAKGWPVDQVIAMLGKSNPELLAVAGDQVQQILTTTYGEMALSGITAPGA